MGDCSSKPTTTDCQQKIAKKDAIARRVSKREKPADVETLDGTILRKCRAGHKLE